MKPTSFFLALVIVSCIGIGCSDEGIPVITPFSGSYRGTFTIQQNAYTTQGSVTLNFADGSYEQSGRIGIPAGRIPDFAESGRVMIENGTMLFNPGRETTMRLYPAWSLLGSFRYEFNGDILTLRQDLGPAFVYTMTLQKQ